MAMTITAPMPTHWHAIRALIHEWGYEADEAQVQAWVEALNASSLHAIWVAISDGEVCGWLVAEQRIALGAGQICEITGLVVGARFRRLGVGQHLIKTAEHWAQQRQLSQVLVRSNITRVESHVFYPSMGFSLKKTSHVYEKALTLPA
ncbi:hypothetical protein BFW38_04430 [Terasakiispira papahanaumokuakeensis]|uniref:Probable N-acetyltransferase 14 n=1 Tax=Terasakiispira papahanaumokuakeensis TaxID=197479 RepID=A0A1E2V7E7_9GAMM|nr:GNAT family N-acetyltransferase [Terasakiispira papahanaumokuakeensis]ODC02911.1 hypothetical protein BFW38_04430 [Terasakiispira papahanaumokuakeensis]